MQKRNKKQQAWSYSALTNFENCPKKHYKTRIEKSVKETFGPATEGGMSDHEAFEVYMKGTGTLPLSLKHHAKTLQQIKEKKGDGYTEQKMAITTDFQPTGYFDNDVWCRGAADYFKIRGNSAVCFDWKFGKVREGNDQLKLMAAMLMCYFPEVDEVTAAFYWAKEKYIVPVKIKREGLPEIWNEFLPRVKRLFTAIERDEFPARPGGLCKKYCPVTTCPHHGG